MKKIFKTTCAIGMSAILTHLPQVAFAETAVPQMISTSEVVYDLSRAQTQERVNDFLQRSDVQQQLLERGVSSEEVSQRVAALSEHELRNLSSQMDEARAGGDILVAILIVVLIIFLIKRI